MIRNKLLALQGISSHFVDAWGKYQQISEGNLEFLLQAMGYPIDDENKLHQAFLSAETAQWDCILRPVYTSRDQEQVHFTVFINTEQLHQPYVWHMIGESGQTYTHPLDLTQFPVREQEQVDIDQQTTYLAIDVSWPLSLAWGYHQMQIWNQEQTEILARSCYIVAPKCAYTPAPIAQGQRIWGVTVQLYSLRSRRNWGVGDFTDLRYLVAKIAEGGGDFVGLNPLHALYPAWPEHASPYSPSSRRWLNIIYIDVEAIPEFVDSEAAIYVAREQTQAQLAQLRASDWVRYQEVTELKLAMLQLVFKQFLALDEGHPRTLAFETFCLYEGESLQAQATFDAIQMELSGQVAIEPHWHSWPEPLQDFYSEQTQQWIVEHERQVKFFAWLQWIASEQLAAVGQQSWDSHMTLGLYCDVAVGVSSGSQEVWCHRENYNLASHIGAPPDVLGPLGQDWGLPPPEPLQQQREHYQSIKEVFQFNMRSCGALRIDHVMGLRRLWWVPKGQGAKNGAYVQYPLDDLLAVLVLESHRNRCLVVGEDLGTVPPEIYEKLQKNGIYSYRVFFFSQAADGGFISPHDYPQQALAALTTHDMPTLRGYWHCDDLSLGQRLGLYPDDERLGQLYDDRLYCKQQILDSLHGHHVLSAEIGHDALNVGMDRSLNYSMQSHMARGKSALLSLQLEDWLEMKLPVNVPGTSDEYPNWRRKLSTNLEDIFIQPHIIQLMKQLSCDRQ